MPYINERISEDSSEIRSYFTTAITMALTAVVRNIRAVHLNHVRRADQILENLVKL